MIFVTERRSAGGETLTSTHVTVESPKLHGATRAPGAALVLLAAALLATWIWSADRGLDRVDESYVLAYIAHPDASRAAGEVNLFGFLLHPLYALVGEDIATFRRVFVVLVAILAAWAADECSRCSDQLLGWPSARSARWLISIGAAAVSLTSFTFGLRSPSYYSVVLAGLLVVVVGMCRLLKGRRTLGAALLAVGWWLVFTGKPSSAAALAIVVLGALAASRALSVRLAVSGTVAVGLISVIVLALVRMSPGDVVAFLAGGVHQDQLLGGHVDVLPMLGLSTGPLMGLVVFGTPIVLAGMAALELARSRAAHRAPYASLLIGIAAVGIAVVGLPSLVDRGLGQQIAPLALVLPLFGLWAVGRLIVTNGADSQVARAAADRRTVIALALFLACLPYVEAVGSNSPFTGAMSQAALFWMLATLVGLRVVTVCRPHSHLDRADDQFPRIAVVVLVLAFAVTGLSMATVLTNGGPGRSLLAASEAVRVAGGTLRLPPDEAVVAQDLGRVGHSAGLSPDTPLVDLTGISAGYAFQLGGRPLGRESFMGVFPGAPDAAAYALAQNSCQDLANAWVLWAPDNPFDVSTKMRLGGRRIPGDYEPVGSFTPVQGPASWRLLTVQVLRPSVSATGCS